MLIRTVVVVVTQGLRLRFTKEVMFLRKTGLFAWEVGIDTLAMYFLLHTMRCSCFCPTMTPAIPKVSQPSREVDRNDLLRDNQAPTHQKFRNPPHRPILYSIRANR